MKRRTFLKLLGASAAAIGFGGSLALAQDRSLRVGVYGGYFKDSFDAHVFPRFTEETGIRVESVAVPTGEAWLVQLETAARAGQAPADVSMMAQVPLRRGAAAGLWTPLDESALPNLEYVRPPLQTRDAEGALVGVGAVSWFITLVTNTDVFPEAPTSWAEFWGDHPNQLGLLALATNSFLLEITARTFLGGTDALDTDEGLEAAFAKLEELKGNVQLWYRDEGQFQQALQSGEIPMGQYYHDVTGLAAADGFPVRSTFPQEGGVLDWGSWAVSRASDKLEEAQAFINWFSQPSVQDLVARQVGTAPTVERTFLGLSDEEFARVSSDIDPIVPKYELYLERGDAINQLWTERITS
ncbi:ABC transporter substrate-binding protein [Truepera radiovictrix]|uniref:Extracellular solute-binding protein family 1 n=1 Tax=Truepera radiovictrix (strain DSM 17093 / CIP 108686 / LMG 22925 / RQ-24) TaxID=649638 RepID=D7CX29_TRURR|nr:ABC transporter substrate-binding protein [Truepera radiovictrix]ADI14537.1 extracellular solute-binding protein family 1 [Truepera radiovictrix DSM 17093]WMT56912.1 ABC transporter substrate-binding protein [Truepera radiovictrix]